jgi:hypothetical protein
MPSEIPLIVVGMIILALGFRLWAGSLDRQRIAHYASEQRWSIISIEWNPLGRGWFGSQNERFYSVTYKDQSGATFSSTCKTSMMAGVYFSEIRQIGPGSPSASSEGFDCPRCGRFLKSDSHFCSNCGEPIQTTLY